MLKHAVGASAVSVGTALSRAGATLILALQRHERVELPAPLVTGGRTIDVLDDLVAYTGLGAYEVRAQVRGRIESYRLEWHLTPQVLRSERWYYLSSRTYLFANAAHFAGADPVLDALESALPAGGRALDFGGGAGNLTIALAARGFQVDYVELSALQKDFVRFRLHRHGLEERVRVLDEWKPLPDRTYDLVCAFDVLEHLSDLPTWIDGRLLPALAPDGALAEHSPFVWSYSNPMHHVDEVGLDGLLHARGLEIEAMGPHLRIWRAGAAAPSDRPA